MDIYIYPRIADHIRQALEVFMAWSSLNKHWTMLLQSCKGFGMVD